MPNKAIWRHLATMMFFVALVSNIGGGQVVQTQADISKSGGKTLILHPSPSTGLIDASPIEINNLGTNNWSWAAEQDWCSGEGTKGNPYIIENLQINGGSGSNTGINITHSHGIYFIIRNCEISDGNYGILIYNTTDGRLEQNNCHHNNKAGILLNHESCNNTVIKNICSYSQSTGWPGIYVVYHSHNNTLRQNYVFNNYHGIGVYESCNSNLIEGNYVYDNVVNGIMTSGFSYFTIIKGNVIWNNGNCGLYLVFSPSNTVYYNAIFQNQEEVISDTIAIYNGSTIGNYWGDYSESDTNRDGIGDTPYALIDGGFDYSPIMNYRPILLPCPPDQTLNKADTLSLSWTVVDDTTIYSTYSIYQDGVKIISDQPWLSEDSILFTKSNLEEGEHLYTIEVNDGYNPSIFDTVRIFVNAPDIEPPSDEEEDQDDKTEEVDDSENNGNELLTVYAIIAAGGLIAIAIIISSLMNRPKIKAIQKALTIQDVKEEKLK